MSAALLPKKPRLPSRPSVGRRTPGAPKAPKPFTGTEAETKPWMTPPPWWTGPQTEWVCYWYLTKIKRWKVYGSHDPNGPRTPIGCDALYQVPIPAPGYKLSNKFRGDYWLLSTGRAGSPGYPYRKGIVWDPVTLFTHPNSGEDIMRRNILAQGEFLLIFIDASDLYTRPIYVLDLAVLGRDVSSIGRGAR